MTTPTGPCSLLGLVQPIDDQRPVEGEVSSRARRRPTDEQLREAKANRDKVVGATRDLFSESGVLASMNEIASRAGVGKGTIYRAFPDRAALLATVAIYQLEEVRAAGDLALSSGREARTAFSEFLRFMLRYNVKNGLYLELFRQESVPREVLVVQATVKTQIDVLYQRAADAGHVSAAVTGPELHFVLNAFVQYLGTSPRHSTPNLRRVEGLILAALGFR